MAAVAPVMSSRRMSRCSIFEVCPWRHGRRRPSARIVNVIARDGLTPVREDAHKAAVRQRRRQAILRQAGRPEPCDGRAVDVNV